MKPTQGPIDLLKQSLSRAISILIDELLKHDTICRPKK